MSNLKKVLGIMSFFLFWTASGDASWMGAVGGSLGTGTLKPIGCDQIEIDNLVVNVELFRDRAKVSAEYILANRGPRVGLQMGFPCLVPRKKSESFDVNDYGISSDGVSLPFFLKKGQPVPWLDIPASFGQGETKPDPHFRWFVSRLSFNQEESKQVILRYVALYQKSASGSSDEIIFDPDVFRYMLSTAGPWKGPIKHGVINVRSVSADASKLTIKPAGKFQNQEGLKFRWEFTDREPTLEDDIEICMNNGFTTTLITDDEGGIRWKTIEKGSSYLDSKKFAATATSQLGDSFGPEMVNDLKNETAWIVRGQKGSYKESLRLTLSMPTRIDAIGLMPGYAKSQYQYFSNNRVAEVQILINDNEVLRRQLEDEYFEFGPWSHKGYQLIDLGGPINDVRTIKLIIEKVFKGGQFNDTAISEILLRTKL